MLGPHQAIRLERLRTELDDELEQAMHAAYSGQSRQGSQAEWAEYYRQQAAFEASQQAAVAPTQATAGPATSTVANTPEAYAKDVPAVPSDVAYEQEQGW
jgi:hypothetical protein